MWNNAHFTHKKKVEVWVLSFSCSTLHESFFSWKTVLNLTAACLCQLHWIMYLDTIARGYVYLDLLENIIIEIAHTVKIGRLLYIDQKLVGHFQGTYMDDYEMDLSMWNDPEGRPPLDRRYMTLDILDNKAFYLLEFDNWIKREPPGSWWLRGLFVGFDIVIRLFWRSDCDARYFCGCAYEAEQGTCKKSGALLGYLYISINVIFCQDRAGCVFWNIFAKKQGGECSVFKTWTEQKINCGKAKSEIIICSVLPLLKWSVLRQNVEKCIKLGLAKVWKVA